MDLLCADARIAVELDGEQHFAGVEAYRRDRRKDLCCRKMAILCFGFLRKMLENGLDEVLNAILRALVHRGRRSPLSASPHLFKIL